MNEGNYRHVFHGVHTVCVHVFGTGPVLPPLLYVELYFVSEILSLISEGLPSYKEEIDSVKKLREMRH